MNNLILFIPKTIISLFVLWVICSEEFRYNISEGVVKEIGSLFLTIILITLLYGWPVIFSKHMATTFGFINKSEARKSKNFFFLFMAVLFISTSIDYFYGRSITPYRLFNLAFIVISLYSAYGMFYIQWTASKALVYAESGGKVAAKKVLVTFLQFFYLPFCIHFIVKRLRKLEE